MTRFSYEQLTGLAKAKGLRIEEHEIKNRYGYKIHLIGIELDDLVWTWFRDSILGGFEFDHKYSQRTGKVFKGYKTAKWPTEDRVYKELSKLGLNDYPQNEETEQD